jgi:hypothetical protein
MVSLFFCFSGFMMFPLIPDLILFYWNFSTVDGENMFDFCLLLSVCFCPL